MKRIIAFAVLLSAGASVATARADDVSNVKANCFYAVVSTLYHQTEPAEIHEAAALCMYAAELTMKGDAKEDAMNRADLITERDRELTDAGRDRADVFLRAYEQGRALGNNLRSGGTKRGSY